MFQTPFKPSDIYNVSQGNSTFNLVAVKNRSPMVKSGGKRGWRHGSPTLTWRYCRFISPHLLSHWLPLFVGSVYGDSKITRPWKLTATANSVAFTLSETWQKKSQLVYLFRAKPNTVLIRSQSRIIATAMQFHAAKDFPARQQDAESVKSSRSWRCAARHLQLVG